jgi:hypothetical protein
MPVTPEMNRRVLSAFMIIVCVGAIVLFLSQKSEKALAVKVIQAILAYQAASGSLPDPADAALMESLGFELRAGWHPDYLPDKDGTFQISLLKGFDGPYWTWDSRIREWTMSYPQ